MGPVIKDPLADVVGVNVPVNTSPGVISDILGNLPNITGALTDIFGIIRPQQPQPQTQNLSPIYLLAGLALLIALTKK
jgi:hypothetical protein